MNRKVLLVADHAFLRDALAEVLHVGRLHAARAALRAGAVGYLPKTLTADEMVAALQQVVAGGRHEPATCGDATDIAALTGLSPRQTSVLDLLRDGASNKLIARELDITASTVKTHLAVIFTCFRVNNRTQVLAAVARRGLSLARRMR